MRRSILRQRVPLFVLLFALVGIAGSMLYHYRFHLIRKFDSRCEGVQAVPVSTMVAAEVPMGWRRCQFGTLQFAVPAELADGVDFQRTKSWNSRRSSDGALSIVLYDGSRTLIVTQFLTVTTKGSKLKQSVNQIGLPVPPGKEGLSPLDLRLAIYRADSSDFRWSMSPEEARWHTWCLRSRPLLSSLSNGASLEVVDDGEIVGLAELGLMGGRVSQFEWRSRDGQHQGGLYFWDDKKALDLDYVRAVCQSVAIQEVDLTEALDRPEDVVQLFHTLPQ